MSKVETVSGTSAGASPSPSPSPQYLEWLRRERRDRLTVRISQLALLVVFLVLWEFAAARPPDQPAVHQLSVDHLADLPRTAEGHAAAGKHPRAHLGDGVRDRARLHRGDGARASRSPAALWWWANLYSVLDPYLVVLNAMPKTAFVPIFYIWLGATLSIYGMSLAISLFITMLMIYSGFQGIDPNKIKLAQTFGATKWQVLTKVVLPGSVPTLIAALKVNAGLSLVGVIVGEFQSATLGLGYLISYGSQIFKMNIVMTAITLLAIVSSLMYLAIYWLESAVMRRR